MSDKEILDWLNEQIVSEIYLDDGRLIDVRGLDVRKAIQASTPPATPAPSHVECLRCRFTGTRPTDGNERNPCPVCGAGVYCHQEEAAGVLQDATPTPTVPPGYTPNPTSISQETVCVCPTCGSRHGFNPVVITKLDWINNAEAGKLAANMSGRGVNPQKGRRNDR